ncbi:MAG: hypothetical protein AAFW81_08705 [Pseudomonadota bacterium]
MKRIGFGAIASAILFSGALTAPAGAQTQPVSNPNGTLASFDAKNVGAILNELGAVWQAQQGNGQSYIAANAGGEINFLLVPTACKGANQTQCVGLSMVAIFEGNANPQTVTAFNYRYAFASAGLDPSGSAYIKRYEISDYGMARGNLATSILVFVEQAKMLQSELSTARRTVALEGYADDLAANALNRTGVAGIDNASLHAKSAVDAHQVGLDEAAAQIKFFIENKSAPRNKIKNISK